MQVEFEEQQSEVIDEEKKSYISSTLLDFWREIKLDKDIKMIRAAYNSSFAVTTNNAIYHWGVNF